MTVVVSSAVLQGTQTAITDETGGYKVTDLPPGTYLVTFYLGKLTLERNDVNVGVDKTTPVFQRIKLSQAAEVVKITATAPTIDPTSTSQGMTIDTNYLRKRPGSGPHVRHRARRRRGLAERRRRGRVLRQLATANKAYRADLGFELGGPILRDRLWFFVGFAPQLARTDITRTTKRQTDCRKVLPDGSLSPCDPRRPSMGGNADGLPDIDPKTGFFLTDILDQEIRSDTAQTYNFLGKLNFAATPRNQVQLSLQALPTFATNPGIFGLASSGFKSQQLTTDLAGKWSGKLPRSRRWSAGIAITSRPARWIRASRASRCRSSPTAASAPGGPAPAARASRPSRAAWTEPRAIRIRSWRTTAR